MLTVTIKNLITRETAVHQFYSFGQMMHSDIQPVLNDLGDRGYVDWIENDRGLEDPVQTRDFTKALARNGYVTHIVRDLDEVIEYILEEEV